MEISSAIIRRLRKERGWPQEQLAYASGLSLRTIQRIEAEGIASFNSAVSIAAVFNVQVKDLQEQSLQPIQQTPNLRYCLLFIGILILTLSLIHI